jgi:hypothetical protein
MRVSGRVQGSSMAAIPPQLWVDAGAVTFLVSAFGTTTPARGGCDYQRSDAPAGYCVFQHEDGRAEDCCTRLGYGRANDEDGPEHRDPLGAVEARRCAHLGAR